MDSMTEVGFRFSKSTILYAFPKLMLLLGSKHPLNQGKGIFHTELHLASMEHNTLKRFSSHLATGKSKPPHNNGTWH